MASLARRSSASTLYPTIPYPGASGSRLEELHVIALLISLGSASRGSRFLCHLHHTERLLCITPCRIRLINVNASAMSMPSTSLSAFVSATRFVSRSLDYGFEEALSESTIWSFLLLLW